MNAPYAHWSLPTFTKGAALLVLASGTEPLPHDVMSMALVLALASCMMARNSSGVSWRGR